ARLDPVKVARRQDGVKSSRNRPGLKRSASVVEETACALTQSSGSLTHHRTRMATIAGAMPTTNNGRQPKSRINRLMKAARRKPAAQADWRMPAPLERLASGQTSATNEAPAAHSPPIPRAVKKRYAASCHQVFERAARPVKSA